MPRYRVFYHTRAAAGLSDYKGSIVVDSPNLRDAAENAEARLIQDHPGRGITIDGFEPVEKESR